MSDTHPVKQLETIYIETPRAVHRPEKISSVLEKRMKEFLRERRRRTGRKSKR